MNRKSYLLSLLSALMMGGALVLFFGFRSENSGENYQYRQFSTVESIIPGGLGRSRVIQTSENGSEVEKELKNFYSMVGINFGNIANNDRAIVERINEWSAQGWELFSVTTGVQSPSVTDNGGGTGGIFITRYLFRKSR
jgi:hypothetical protein